MLKLKLIVSIARGSLKNTIIGCGTKIDGLIHIAHNTVIRKNFQITAGVVIGGSVSKGDNSWLGLNCTLKHKIKVGQRAIVGSGASVINHISDEDIVAGVPAKSIKNKLHPNNFS
jgi:UDP-3-O-[3-hydroxymyristoyl] glucosamine N-acyltransferase